MSHRKVAVVVTTISEGGFIDVYEQRILASSRLEQVTLYVVGDLNTPQSCAERARRAAADGMSCLYLDPADQDQLLAPFPELGGAIPWRSDQRRNLGYLAALRDGHDVLISVDDDNFPLSSTFFDQHSIVGTDVQLPVSVSPNGWFNIASRLEIVDRSGRPVSVFPRGFPYCMRESDASDLAGSDERGLIGVNVGLWIGDPDIDAATRLVTGCVSSCPQPTSVLLAARARTPINSQNTALVAQAIPAYYFVRMGARVGGLVMERFADILSGYFLQICAEAVGHRVSIGPPLVEQQRNPHNLFKDLQQELPGMTLIEELVPLIAEPLPRCSTYGDAYLQLAARLEKWAVDAKPYMWADALQPYIRSVADLMWHWVAACRELAPPELGL